ncbi:MAG TPA: FMN-dependent NADH-azoreductase [Rhodanobacteraceae bacterium]|nr:FMN-dependent NADH-azoreductase [Rhodanobacteraceae bacterium]
MKLLHLDTSALGSHSVSRQLSAAIVEKWVQDHPGTQVDYHDLAADPIPHWLPVVDTSREPDHLGERVLADFLAADVIVIGAPMYNFSISSQLKAWIDRIAVPGKAFRYTENGPEGLAGGKRVIIASSRGGVYSEGPATAADFQEPYLRTVLGFFGITDIRFVRAEGVGLGPEQKAQAIETALADIHQATALAA